MTYFKGCVVKYTNTIRGLKILPHDNYNGKRNSSGKNTTTIVDSITWQTTVRNKFIAAKVKSKFKDLKCQKTFSFSSF